MTFNDLAARLLRSPFHWMLGADTMLITVIGRKSGRPVTVPVNFHAEEEALWVTSRRDRVWWRNLPAHPEMTVWLHGKQRSGRGELVFERNAVAEQLARIYAGDPALARALHVRLDPGGRPDPEDQKRVVEDRLLIKVSLN